MFYFYFFPLKNDANLLSKITIISRKTFCYCGLGMNLSGPAPSNVMFIFYRQMKRHFKEQGHTVTKAVRCECGVLFRCGTAGAYYLHRSCVFLLFINHNSQGEYVTVFVVLMHNLK